MRRVTGWAAVFGFVCVFLLAFGLAVGPAGSLSVAWADDDDDEQQEQQADDVSPPSNPDFDEPRVDGIIYSIGTAGRVTTLVVYDLDIGQSVAVFVRDPALKLLVDNGTACVGRYVDARGIRTGPNTLDAQSLTVDTTKPCGTPPK